MESSTLDSGALQAAEGLTFQNPIWDLASSFLASELRASPKDAPKDDRHPFLKAFDQVAALWPFSSTSASASAPPAQAKEAPKEEVPKEEKAADGSWSAMDPDPSVLKWLNEKQLKPGGTTCGFMTVPLGSLPTHAKQFPDVKVYICIKFAATQPAPKGTIFAHCGGPSSLSGCGVSIAAMAGGDYNAVGIDQRGLGRSLPTFAVENCTGKFGPSPYGMFNDDLNETETRVFLGQVKERAFTCFNDPSFQLSSKDGSEVHPGTDTFNFLQYSGTSHVAEDLESFRQAIGAPKISLHGASYGTMIAMSYATMFPDKVDKFILNSPMPPMPSSFYIGWDAAYGMEQLWDNLAFACDMLKERCPVTAPGGTAVALRTVFDALRSRDIQVPLTNWQSQNQFGENGRSFPGTIAGTLLFGGGQNPNMYGVRDVLMNLQPLYQDIVNGDYDKFEADFLAYMKQKLATLFPPEPEGFESFFQASESDDADQAPLGPDDEWRPSGGYIAGQPQYAQHLATGVPGTIVLSQSTSGNALNENYFIAQLRKVQENYPNMGLGKSSMIFRSWWSYTYAWPRQTPVASAGAPLLKGLIVGFLYDPNTPFKWAQESHQAFPSTSMVISQASQHCLTNQATIADPKSYALAECWNLVANYLDTGEVPLSGAMCRAPVPVVM